jgi:EAL domain-containing protein (putative c-di-GMP-specific phosphodiesterase class I)/ActR/RegA family two-component response regulator
MRLVVLDDDKSITDFMATVARECGWEADTATDELAFRALVRAAPPDAILLDLQLGETDGIAQLHFLHSVNYAGAIVLMSGFDARVLASAQHIGESLGLRIAALIEKPSRSVEIRDVITAIERSFGTRPTGTGEVAHDAVQARYDLISARDVAEAINAGQMELHLQPIVAAAGHGVTSAEALIRWRDPVRGLLPPGRFVSVAETDDRVIDQMTMWAVQTGAAQYRRLAQLGSAIRIFVNISGRNLLSLDFPDRMAALRERMAVPDHAIGLEITESVAMEDLDVTESVLTRLRLKGFSVALDDFGTGHSSLTALRRMPFSAIKIDKSFVGELQTSSDSFTIVKSVIQLARDMRLESVAEGVENADAARLLTELGIDYLQGYYFSPPRPFDAFTAWLNGWPRGATSTTNVGQSSSATSIATG